MTRIFLTRIFALTLVLMSAGSLAAAEDLTQWQPFPMQWKPTVVAPGQATLQNDRWAYLVTPAEHANVEVSATITIESPATQFGFFGASWSAWPDPTFGDRGFEAALLLRSDEERTRGYRVQISHKLQEVALVRFPDGGYVRSVPCEVKTKTPIKLQAKVAGGVIRVSVDGRELIHYVDRLESGQTSGRIGIGVASAAKVTFSEPKITAVEAESTPPPQPHQVKLRARTWLGGRTWVFDGDEPILQLHSEKDPSCFAKLKPGYMPQLTFDSHWGLENQGAFPEAASKWTEPVTSGGGETVKANWSARNVKDHFTTKSTLTVGFDHQRATYTYAIQSELEVLAGEPFHFRYGFDFEHHTPLDPFRWQYLIARKRGGELYHRPVYPIDPGPQNDLEAYHGLRVWYGRHNGDLQVAPAVEYETESAWNEVTQKDGKTSSRLLNTAVCAAFYDTGICFLPETAKPGTKVRVKYRYTGYPVDEAKKLFEQSKIYDSPTLDPNHHYIFADEWPKLTFRQFVPMSETWIYGRTPFLTNHNQRPTYELEKNCGAGSGFAMKLGPASFGKARLAKAAPLASGRYVVTALVKADNVHGPGGRIELEAKEAKTNKLLASAKHFVGKGTFDWQRQGFAFDAPEEAGTLEIAFGNAGTGNFLVTEVEFRKLADGEALPAGTLARANDQSAPIPPAPDGAVADYRMLEGKGFVVLNHATGGLGHLDLANLDFVTDEGRPAVRFADNTTDRRDFRIDGALNRFYFSSPSQAHGATMPLALTGHHGGGAAIPGLTLAAWVKPAAEMGKSRHGGKGDIVGYGARRFILGLQGAKAPYQLVTRINVNDSVVSKTTLDADHWYHVAMTAEPKEGQWLVRLYLDGQMVGTGATKKFPADSTIVPSLIMGAEIFYFHDAFYRGLIGRTLVLHRVATADEIQTLAK